LVKKLHKYAGDAKTWQEVVKAAVTAGVDLSETGENALLLDGGKYNVYGACLTHVEIDVLTGEVEVLDAQIFYDCGRSLNPAVDIGQVEGCFMMGLGFSLCEQQERSESGRLITNTAGTYLIPSSLDVPQKMDVHFIESTNAAKGNVMGSKASGEPALVMSTCPFFAVKHAIYAARADVGDGDFFQLDVPANPEAVALACKVAQSLGQ